MPFRTPELLQGQVHCAPHPLAPRAHQRAARAASLVAEPRRRAGPGGVQQTFGLSHHVVEMDAFSEQIGPAFRASRNSCRSARLRPPDGRHANGCRAGSLLPQIQSRGAAPVVQRMGQSSRTSCVSSFLPRHGHSPLDVDRVPVCNSPDPTSEHPLFVGTRATLITYGRAPPPHGMGRVAPQPQFGVGGRADTTLVNCTRRHVMAHGRPIDLDAFYSSAPLEVWRQVLGDRMHYHHGIWAGGRELEHRPGQRGAQPWLSRRARRFCRRPGMRLGWTSERAHRKMGARSYASPSAALRSRTVRVAASTFVTPIWTSEIPDGVVVGGVVDGIPGAPGAT